MKLTGKCEDCIKKRIERLKKSFGNRLTHSKPKRVGNHWECQVTIKKR